MKLSPTARMVKAAVSGFLTPHLAMDSQLGDLTPIVGGIKSIKSAKSRSAIVAKVEAAFTGKLAEDADLSGLGAILASLANDEEDDEPKKKTAEDEEDDEDETPKPKANDNDEPETVKKTAMDAAIKSVREQTAAAYKAVRQAEIDVAPLVGPMAMAMDSAADVYMVALKAGGVDVTGVHPSAYGAMVDMLKKQKAAAPAKLASDSAVVLGGGATQFNALFSTKG